MSARSTAAALEAAHSSLDIGCGMHRALPDCECSLEREHDGMGTLSQARDVHPGHAVLASAHENLLVAAIPSGARHRIAFERVAIEPEQTIYDAGAALTHYVFPLVGILSLVKDLDGDTIEVGTVGHEGMVGISALLGVPSTTTRIFAQSPGVIERIGVDELDAVMDTSVPTRRLLLRYANAFHEEVAQSVACNRLHSLEERCARWLLITHDRTGSDVMYLKQRFLSYMLGVHRPAVSLAASALQRAGIISYRRGTITLLDRSALEEASCACYRLGRDAYARARLHPISLSS